MRRELSQLAVVSLFGFMIVAWFTNVREWIGFSIYLFLVLALPLLVYKPLIRTIDPRFPFSLFLLAFLAKLLGSAMRYWSLVDIYEGVGDSVAYHEKAIEISSLLSAGDFSVLKGFKTGTAGLDLFTGIVYSFFPHNMEGAFLLFAAFAFVGSVFFYRAFVLAFPDSTNTLYRIIIFFLPSILFWPSSLGKDALVFFGLGLIAYGLVLLMRKGSVRGLIWVSVGLAALLLVRPYTAGFLILAAGIANIFVPNRTSRGSLGLWLLSGCLLVVIGFFVVQQSADFLADSGLKEFSWQGLMDFYQSRKASSTVGGSRTDLPLVSTLFGPLYAIVTVLFRPFVWEVHNPQALLASLESFLFIVLMFKRRRLLFSRIRNMPRDPLIAFLIIFSIVMILIQTTTGNLGIIARQRVQFLPFLLMLIA